MKTALIIGASGYTGYTVAKFAAKIFNIYGTYNERPISIPDIEKMLPLDKTKEKNVKYIFDKIEPEIVIDCSALQNAIFCENNFIEAWKTNVLGTLNVARSCLSNRSKMIYISTDYVFDGQKGNYKESDIPKPINTYGKTKSMAEHIVKYYLSNYAILRPAVLYGWMPKDLIGRPSSSRRNDTFAEWVFESLSSGKAINLYTDQKNNSTFINNLAESIIEIGSSPSLTGIFHTCGKDCLSRYDQGIQIAEATNLDKSLISPVKTVDKILKRPLNLCLNTSKTESQLRTPLLTYKEGIQKMFKKR